jgi:(1->4)-alpha-D-glucan 1-alpha-D-glucosylmutase
MTTPTATYRLQLRNGFTFADAAKVVRYLAKLGISHVYLSPIFRSAPGSTHGYDTVDFNTIEPELGGSKGFDALVAELDRFGLKALIDFVPNHMAAHPDNPWWRDVLEWGERSRYANHFDIDWSAPKLLVPILGGQYGDVLAAGELRIDLDPDRGEFIVRYFDNALPLSPTTYSAVLGSVKDEELQKLAKLPRCCLPAECEDLKAELKRLFSSRRDPIEQWLRQLNGQVSEIHSLLELQPWRLAYWRTAREMLTYRRFFEISDLIGVRVERPEVFADVHRTILALIQSGKIDGLRIDHIDGLADPKGYLDQLRRATAAKPDLYLVVEKILGEGEDTRADWPIDGTTGYEFIRDVSTLFIADDLSRLTQGYSEFTSASHDYAAESLAVKRRTLSFNLAAELRGLAAMATAIANANVATRDFGPETLRAAIVEVAAHFATYRTYVNREGATPDDLKAIQSVAQRAKSGREIEDPAAIDFVISLISGRPLSPSLKADAEAFAVKFQQTTGPLMAKAVEDTEFYRFNRLIALNEVGGEPEHPRRGIESFHRAMTRRQSLAPRALSATATHDTKRGEDARVRLYGLSKVQEEWCLAAERWRRLLGEARAAGLDGEAEWLFFQTLAGVWPMDGNLSVGLVERIEQFMIKAAREAKLHTSWTNPSSEYEDRITAFVRRALVSGNPFLEDFTRTIAPLANAGAAASLVQTVLKVFAPGVPDIYQGTELWDFSLVDPDNRRAVNFEMRQRLLELCTEERCYDEGDWRNGRIKLDVLRRSLALRQNLNLVSASYEPLDGDLPPRCFAFMRRCGGRPIIVIGAVPNPTDYQGSSRFNFAGVFPGAATVSLPKDVQQQKFCDVFAGTHHMACAHLIKLAEVLRYLPVALLLPLS